MKIIYPCPILCPCTLFKQPWGRDTEQISSAEEKLPLYLLSPRSQINLLNKLNYDIIVALIDFKIGLLLSGRLSKSVLHTAHVHQTRLTYLVSRTSFKIRGVIQQKWKFNLSAMYLYIGQSITLDCTCYLILTSFQPNKIFSKNIYLNLFKPETFFEFVI